MKTATIELFQWDALKSRIPIGITYETCRARIMQIFNYLPTYHSVNDSVRMPIKMICTKTNVFFYY